MKKFVALFQALDTTTSTNAKVAGMVEYFQTVPTADAAWATYFLTGERIKRFITSRDLQNWAIEMTGMPEWLFKDAYHTVGDTAETVALLVGQAHSNMQDKSLQEWIEREILPLMPLSKPEQGERVKQWWRELDTAECFVLNKIITGAFRVGVSKALVLRALAQVAQLEPAIVAHRFIGAWQPSAEFFQAALSPAGHTSAAPRPYPFYLAYPLEQTLESIGEPEEWLAEWKWDGIRGQMMHQGGEVLIWSRGEELVTAQFPELEELARRLPEGAVLDGEILAWANDAPLDFAALQKRLGRKKPGAAVMRESPVVFMAYDLLQYSGEDWRERPLHARKSRLTQLAAQVEDTRLMFSPILQFQSWEDLGQLRAQARAQSVEGLMLKRRESTYQVGRKKGDWWKWKIDPYTIDAVLLYAQPGSGRRANLYTDYTFALWQGDELVPVAKAYSGLTDSEINRVDNWVRRNTVERFGPVRSVKPELVFELAFENIAFSKRHKSGVAVRFPRIKRWREDKPFREADTLDNLKALINTTAPAT
ncbi:MAG: ATP-dependent DNA ligase [Cellvibrionaceae bacterium]|nr:ATP-dependent DNA ligase [Cellvibrionaceae bacterium]